jgi:non-heme chloroperoxidase
MATLTVGQENNADIDLYYEDHGTGKPVVLIHGYPLNGHSWEKQERVLLEAGHRVITYDRRGFGASSQPVIGYDYDTLAADLRMLLDFLDLRDAVLVGFSMGTGEVTRYLGTYGSARIAQAVLIGALQPFLLKTPDNPQGIEASAFEQIRSAVSADRPAFSKSFLENALNADTYIGTRISEQALQSFFITAVGASAHAARVSVDTWLTDFRADLPKIDVPTLLVHGNADRIAPYANTAARLAGLIDDLRVVTIEGDPHNVAWTHAAEVNAALLDFLRMPSRLVPA